jgi:hypothetical protein
MWEVMLVLRLIASTVPARAATGDLKAALALPAGFFQGSIRLAYAAYRLSARTPPAESSHKNNETKTT